MERVNVFAKQVLSAPSFVQRCLKPLSVHWPQEVLRPHVRKADLNEAAGAADASRARLSESCFNVTI